NVIQLPAGSYTGTMGPKDIFFLVYTVIMTPTGDVNQPPHALRFGNIVFDLSAFFNYNLLPGYRFPTPITLDLTYDPALLGGLSEATLELFYWDGAAWSSDGITLLARDTANHKITLSLAHLSEIAVFGSAPTALEPGDEPDLGAVRLYLPVVAQESVLAEPAAPSVAAPDVPLPDVATPTPESDPAPGSDEPLPATVEPPPPPESATPEETPLPESAVDDVAVPPPPEEAAETPLPEADAVVPEAATPEAPAERLLLPWIAR
ncbi:MAG: hypothetical protein KDD91_23295, partial [Caldilinea sp.]|nr:hypothetical protein [Caldilinea sp.]